MFFFRSSCPCGEQSPGAGAGAPAGLGVCEGEGRAHPLTDLLEKFIFEKNRQNNNMQNLLFLD